MQQQARTTSVGTHCLTCSLESSYKQCTCTNRKGEKHNVEFGFRPPLAGIRRNPQDLKNMGFALVSYTVNQVEDTHG